MIPNWAFKIPWPIVREITQEFSIDPLIIASMIMVESSGNACAIKHEPGWDYVWKEQIFEELVGSYFPTEREGQKTSWGLMQVMGTVAREYGFRGWFPELCDPKIGIYYGVKYFKSQLERYGTIENAISAYNWGSVELTPGRMYKNQRYVDKVMRYYREVKDL